MLEKEKRLEIQEYTEEVRKKFEIGTPFVKYIDEILKKLGGKIQKENTIESYGKLIIETKPWEGIFKIILNPGMIKERDNFAIAHQLGHLFLHTNYIESMENGTKYIHFNESYINSEADFEAHEFAYNLLMPKKEFLDELKKNTKGEVVYTPKVAKYFGVTISIASYRGQKLGYLQSFI